MVAPEDFIKVADKGNEFLNSSIVNHQRRLTEAINQLEKNIIDQVKEFKTTNGTLLGPRINMKQAQKIHGQLNSMFAETYGKEARAVSTGFNKAAKYIQNELGELDLAAVFTSVDKDMIDTLKKSSWGTFNKFGLTAQEQMTDQMYNAIIGKAPFSTLVTNFQGILSGHKDARGRPMSTYANLYANDAIMNFHNSVHMKKAEDAGIKYFMYYGNLMTTSRDFCIQRIGKVYSKEVIDSWDYNWGGKSGPAFTNRGGYNCRHRWVAVRKNWLDDSVEVFDNVEVPAKKVVKKSREALQAEYDTLKTKYLAEENFSTKWKMRPKVTAAENALARTYTEVELLEAKTQIMVQMTELEGKMKLTKAMRGKLQYTADWIPHDLLTDVRDRGARIIIKDMSQSAWRAQYGEDLQIYLAKNDTAATFSHEFGHLIDGHFNSDYKSGFGWGDGKFVTQKEGKNLRTWFREHHPTNTRGVYKNGDGQFWENNWITDYEGRIYSTGHGQEWWAMNCQRYAQYRNDLTVGFDKYVAKLEGDAEVWDRYVTKLKGWVGTPEGDKVRDLTQQIARYDQYVVQGKLKVQATIDNGKEAWALNHSKWGKVKERYPKLSGFMEEKFGQPFMQALE